jgi:hypothetical protein
MAYIKGSEGVVTQEYNYDPSQNLYKFSLSLLLRVMLNVRHMSLSMSSKLMWLLNVIIGLKFNNDIFQI